MQFIENLSTFEIAELDNNQLQTLIDRALMAAGVVLPPKPTPPVTNTTSIEPIGTVYKVTFAHSWGAAYLTDEQEAFNLIKATSLIGVSDTVIKSKTYHYIGDRSHYESSVIPIPIYNPTDVAKLKDHAERTEHLEKQYKASLDEWESSTAQASEIIDNVMQTYHDACAQVAKLTQILDTLVDYTRLANGDVTVALPFLLKAYSQELVDKAFQYRDWRAARITEHPTPLTPQEI